MTTSTAPITFDAVFSGGHVTVMNTATIEQAENIILSALEAHPKIKTGGWLGLVEITPDSPQHLEVALHGGHIPMADVTNESEAMDVIQEALNKDSRIDTGFWADVNECEGA